MMNKLFDYLLLAFLIIVMCLAASCTIPTEDDELFGIPEMELNANLP